MRGDDARAPLSGDAPSIRPSLDELLLLLPAEEFKYLRRRAASPDIRKRREKQCRDAFLVLAIGITASANEIARIVHAKASRYAVGAWRFERDKPAPSDASRIALHRALTLSGGIIPSERTLRRWLTLGHAGHFAGQGGEVRNSRR